MSLIKKFELVTGDGELTRLPLGPNDEIIHIGYQFDRGVMLWAVTSGLPPGPGVGPYAVMEVRTFRCVGTGQHFFYDAHRTKHAGTAISSDGFVWHFFEELRR